MTREELQQQLINKYTMLQLIKRDNGNQKNPTLDYNIKTTAVELEIMGINVEGLTIKEEVSE